MILKLFLQKTFALLLLAILIIPSIIIILFIKMDSKGPSIHLSKRIGINNQIFLMPKFRTMKIGTKDVASHKLHDANIHITKVGKILRKYSIDEIPQLISIIKGDMNFIGPRPALFNQSDLINLRTKNNIHLIKPGITGLAQINGRDNNTIKEKVDLDLEYMINQSLFLDMKIFIFTFFKVIFSKNIKH